MLDIVERNLKKQLSRSTGAHAKEVLALVFDKGEGELLLMKHDCSKTVLDIPLRKEELYIRLAISRVAMSVSAL